MGKFAELPEAEKTDDGYMWETCTDIVDIAVYYTWNTISNVIHSFWENGHKKELYSNVLTFEEANAKIHDHYVQAIKDHIQSLEDRVKYVKATYYDNLWS